MYYNSENNNVKICGQVCETTRQNSNLYDVCIPHIQGLLDINLTDWNIAPTLTHGHKHACIQYTLLCHVSWTILCGLKYFPKHPPIITRNYLFSNYPVYNTVEKFIFHLGTVCLNLLPLQLSLNVTNFNSSWYW